MSIYTEVEEVNENLRRVKKQGLDFSIRTINDSLLDSEYDSKYERKCQKDHDYIFTSPGQNQYYPQNPTSFIDPSAGLPSSIPYRNNPVGFQSTGTIFPPLGGFYSRDLETSDLPRKLQETLPQYRQNQNINPTGFGNRIVNAPIGFRPSKAFVQPSTHRPNYSHLFSQAHLKNPSQPETFLGEVQLDNPVESPSQYNNFKPLKTEDGNSFGTRNSVRNDILKTRTRFLAPERGGKKLSEVKNYLIDNNGGVYTDTSKTPFSPKPTQTASPPRVTQRKNLFSPTPKPTERAISFNIRPDKKPFVPKNAKNNEQKNSLDLESLLEEPISNYDSHSNKDNVEVIKDNEKKLNESEYEEETENPLEYEEYEDEEAEEEQENGEHENYVQGNESQDDEKENETQKGDHLLGENDNHLENSTTEDDTYETATVQTSPKPVISSQRTFEENATSTSAVTQVPIMVSMVTSVNLKPQQFSEETQPSKEKSEVVVSVVTSKTVVNNTILGTITEKPLVTEPIRTTEIINADNTTDSWVVVASVQTSRSISGARYLPKGIIQDERIKLLNEHEDYIPSSSSGNPEEETTTEIDAAVQTSSEAPLTEVETSTKSRTSTESLIEKLERVESDVASGLLSGGFKTDNIAVINAANAMPDREMTTLEATSPMPSTTKDPYPLVKIRKYSPANRLITTHKPRSKENFKKLQATRTTSTTSKAELELPQGDQPGKGNFNIEFKNDISALLPPGFKPEKVEKPESNSLLAQILAKAKAQTNNISTETTTSQPEKTTKKNEDEDDEEEERVNSFKPSQSKYTTKKPPVTVLEDVSKFLPPGFKETKFTTRKPPVTVLEDVNKFLPPGYKPPKTTSKPPVTVLDDVSKFLPPGYKGIKDQKETKTDSPLKVTKDDADVTKFLPPGFKLPRTTNKPPPTVLDDVSKFLPPGYKQRKYEKGGFKTTEGPKTTSTTIEKAKDVQDLFKKAEPVDISSLLPTGFNKISSDKSNSSNDLLHNLLPPGFKLNASNTEKANPTEASTSATVASAGDKKQIKLVFPGQKSRKGPRLTTPKSSDSQDEAKPSAPTIHKGWPSRATTEFTGWKTPSTTPISIEKLLEAARTATASSSTTDTLTDVTSTTTTTTTTTTTQRPTTPGICKDLCELAGTIKILDNEKWKWKPEYLDRNTQEYQNLADAVEDQLNEVFQSSTVLRKWYKNIRVDGFSQGSILVDYFVELIDVGQINTVELKQLFHDALTNQDLQSNAALKQNSSREAKALNKTTESVEKLSLGQFVVDPKYTDFVVIPKSIYPTVGYAEDNVLLPQWAIAVIVIGLASLLFVIIFGVTVLANRQKNSKKKGPTPLTEDMLNELNKNHMGGYDNYAAEDLYNMEDVWNERAYDQNPKKRSNGSINDHSTANLYDSWRSDWNGYYYNNYYGNHGSQHSGYSGRRRSDYDTNF